MIKKRKTRWKLRILLIFACLMAGGIFSLTGSAEEIAKTREELIRIIYDHMKNQEETIVVYYLGADYKEVHEQFLDKILPEEIYTIDDKDTSDDFDYMFYNLEKVEIHTKSELIGNAKITLKLTWKENRWQIEQVNKRIKQILDRLDIEKDSQYEKVKKIHDYVIKTVKYDNSLTYFTTYDSLFKGKATCQGYMLLTYKLLTMAGVECRCIDGKGIGQKTTESHGWNIVKLGEKWYNMDVTWDDPVIYKQDGSITEEGKEAFQYDFFLKGSKNFNERHIANERYTTPAFIKNYPISETDFSKKEYETWRENHSEQILKEKDKNNRNNIKKENLGKKELLLSTIQFRLKQILHSIQLSESAETAIPFILIILIGIILIKILNLLKK